MDLKYTLRSENFANFPRLLKCVTSIYCVFDKCLVSDTFDLQDNYTPLHIAVESVKPAVIETLLGYGADVHVRGKSIGIQHRFRRWAKPNCLVLGHYTIMCIWNSIKKYRTTRICFLYLITELKKI